MREKYSNSNRALPTINNAERNTLRQALRRRRRSLCEQDQQRASLQALKQTKTLGIFLRAEHLALYIANDGELDPSAILRCALKMGKTCYLPVIDPIHSNQLQFAPYQLGDRLITNQFGILEPAVKTARLRKAFALDVVFTPLVGFDAEGNRMGMGGGYYDKTFAFKQNTHGTPQLIGLAHECQKVENLNSASWDIPMATVISDAQIYVPQNS